MKIDQNKLRALVARKLPSASSDELRREENVFFVGGDLPEQQTLETLFESHYQSQAALFHLSFSDPGSFAAAERLARVIKKNFNAHLVGRMEFAAPPHLIERAYAAGVDIVSIPMRVLETSSGRGDSAEEVRAATAAARSVFPRWSVVSTLAAGEEPASATIAKIDALLAAEVVPLVTLSARAAGCSVEEISRIYTHLHAGWRRSKALIKPLLPLIYLSTPLVPAIPQGRVRGLIDIIDGRRLLATSDLRRMLRVKEVEESYASSGL